MEEREARVRLWFSMWLQKTDLGMEHIFAEDATYVESWGPLYRGRNRIQLWFHEWNTRGSVTIWDIRQFFHKGKQTIVEWYFKNEMDSGKSEAFDGISLITWTDDNRIRFLKEFGYNISHYDPYETGTKPVFREETSLWF